MTFEDYLRKQTVTYNGTVFPATEHIIRVTVDDSGVRFYVHPANTDGDTRDFEVHGNTLVADPRVTIG